MSKKTNVLVYGPQACGKTINADAICKHFGAKGAIDEYEIRGPVENMVIFTSDINSDYDFSFDELKQLIPLQNPIKEF